MLDLLAAVFPEQLPDREARQRLRASASRALRTAAGRGADLVDFLAALRVSAEDVAGEIERAGSREDSGIVSPVAVALHRATAVELLVRAIEHRRINARRAAAGLTTSTFGGAA